MMYTAKLKARSEDTDVAGTHTYFFASFDNRGSLWLFSFYHLRWWESNVMQPCNNWRRGFQLTALGAPAEAVEAIHGVMSPVLFQGFSWASVDHVAS